MPAYNDYQNVIMTGASGTQVIDSRIFIQQTREINFLTFYNLTNNIVTLYDASILPGAISTAMPLVSIGLYSAITLPFFDFFKNGFLIAWTNTIPSTYLTPQVFRVATANENLNVNVSQASGWQTITPATQVDITGNSIGLANASQLPTTLSALGNLEVAIVEPVVSDVNVYVESAANTAATAALPAISGKANYCTSVSVSQTGAVIKVTGLKCQLLDGATILYEFYIPAAALIGTTYSRDFSYPIKGTLGNALNLTVEAGGNLAITHNTITGFAR